MARCKSKISTPFYNASKKDDAELAPHREAANKIKMDLLVKFGNKYCVHHSSLQQLFDTRKDNVKEEEFTSYDQYVDYLACYEAWTTVFDRYAKEHNISWY